MGVLCEAGQSRGSLDGPASHNWIAATRETLLRSHEQHRIQHLKSSQGLIFTPNLSPTSNGREFGLQRMSEKQGCTSASVTTRLSGTAVHFQPFCYWYLIITSNTNYGLGSPRTISRCQICMFTAEMSSQLSVVHTASAYDLEARRGTGGPWTFRKWSIPAFGGNSARVVSCTVSRFVLFSPIPCILDGPHIKLKFRQLFLFLPNLCTTWRNGSDF